MLFPAKKDTLWRCPGLGVPFLIWENRWSWPGWDIFRARFPFFCISLMRAAAVFCRRVYSWATPRRPRTPRVAAFAFFFFFLWGGGGQATMHLFVFLSKKRAGLVSTEPSFSCSEVLNQTWEFSPPFGLEHTERARRRAPRAMRRATRQDLWKMLDRDGSGFASIDELDPRSAQALAYFKKTLDQNLAPRFFFFFFGCSIGNDRVFFFFF